MRSYVFMLPVAVICAIPASAQVRTTTTTSTTTSVGATRPTTSIEDPNILNAVTAAAIRYGKLALSTRAHPGANYLPDGTFARVESFSRFVVKGGLIVGRVKLNGEVTPIESIRLDVGVLKLSPEKTPGMTQTEMILPDGNYKTEDGRTTLTLTGGKPTRFVLPGTT
jgi:hypothetical protein